jgi:hypothetical protein
MNKLSLSPPTLSPLSLVLPQSPQSVWLFAPGPSEMQISSATVMLVPSSCANIAPRLTPYSRNQWYVITFIACRGRVCNMKMGTSFQKPNTKKDKEGKKINGIESWDWSISLFRIWQTCETKSYFMSMQWLEFHKTQTLNVRRPRGGVIHFLLAERAVVALELRRLWLCLIISMPLWSSGQSFWLQIHRPWVPFSALPDFLRSSGSGTGSTQPREDNWGATWKN